MTDDVENDGPHTETDDVHDARRYGRSFVDVYDDWYPASNETAKAVQFVAPLCTPEARLLELGIGTGRLALELAANNIAIDGIDAPQEMLDILETKTPDHLQSKVHGILGDVSDPTCWPTTKYPVILAAYNLVFNITTEGGIEQVATLAADHLDDDGVFIVETFTPDLPEDEQTTMSVKAVTLSGVDLIATHIDPLSQLVIGQHIELRSQSGTTQAEVHLRPWALRVATLDQLDDMATAAILQLSCRHEHWADAIQHHQGNGECSAVTAQIEGPGIVSIYRRSPSR